MDANKDKLYNLLRKIAGVAYRKGMPLHLIVRCLWNEYDRLFGWDMLTPEQKDALIAELTAPRDGQPIQPVAVKPKPLVDSNQLLGVIESPAVLEPTTSKS